MEEDIEIKEILGYMVRFSKVGDTYRWKTVEIQERNSYGTVSTHPISEDFVRGYLLAAAYK